MCTSFLPIILMDTEVGNRECLVNANSYECLCHSLGAYGLYCNEKASDAEKTQILAHNWKWTLKFHLLALNQALEQVNKCVCVNSALGSRCVSKYV